VSIVAERPRDKYTSSPSAAVTTVAVVQQPSRWLALGLAAIGVGLAAVALLGPLASELIDYRVGETLRNQLIGLDAVSLFFVAPLALIAAALVLRRHIAGPLLALGVGAYTSYMFVQYILGPDYVSRGGNNERLFPLALFLFALGWGVALAAWNAIDVERLPRSRRERRIGLFILPVLALAAFGRYVPSLIDWMSSSPGDKNYLAGPSFAWAIAMLDLGVFLPATIAACIGLVRGTRWAPKAVYTVVGWFGLVGSAVAAMAIAMYVNDDPIASGGNTVFMSVLGGAFLLLALFLYRPLLRRSGQARMRGTR
jgi:hypothetical protein